MIRRCLYCRQDFEAASTRARYCCPAHRVADCRKRKRKKSRRAALLALDRSQLAELRQAAPLAVQRIKDIADDYGIEPARLALEACQAIVTNERDKRARYDVR